MKPPRTLSDEHQMGVYQQNAETFRALNQLMWQIPLIAMSLTGGLWFGVARSETAPVLQLSLLGLAAAGNFVLIFVLARLRYIMGEYLAWLEDFYPEGFVSAASGEKLWERPATVRTLFQIMLGLAAIVSLVLMANTAVQADWFSSASPRARAVAYYDRNAEDLAERYEGLSFQVAHPELAEALVGARPMRVLDVGAGSGRDASAMAALGNQVTAVEPSDRMRALARRLHPAAEVRWIEDALPDLMTLDANRYDVVLLSAVWMHVEPSDRSKAFDRLAELLAPGGRLYVSLRIGPAAPERAIHPVSEAEVTALARAHRLSVTTLGQRADLLGRTDVRWIQLVIARDPQTAPA